MQKQNSLVETAPDGIVDDPGFDGRHILLELKGVSSILLQQKDELESNLVRVAEESGATVVKSVIHEFNPYGLSGVVVIAESHIAIHTWPEYRHASVDIFTCGNADIAKRIAEGILKALDPDSWESETLSRGASFSRLQRASSELIDH